MPWARVAKDDACTVQSSQSRTTEGRRGRSPLRPTKLTSGLQDGCTQLLEVKLRILPAAGTPWAGLRPLAPLADPVSRRQKQESVPVPSCFPGWREEDGPPAFHLPRVNGWFGRTPRPGAMLSGCRAAGTPRTAMEAENQEAWPAPQHTHPHKDSVQSPPLLPANPQGPARQRR